MRLLRLAVHQPNVARVSVTVHPSVAYFLLNRRRALISALKTRRTARSRFRATPRSAWTSTASSTRDARDRLVDANGADIHVPTQPHPQSHHGHGRPSQPPPPRPPQPQQQPPQHPQQRNQQQPPHGGRDAARIRANPRRTAHAGGAGGADGADVAATGRRRNDAANGNAVAANANAPHAEAAAAVEPMAMPVEHSEPDDSFGDFGPPMTPFED